MERVYLLLRNNQQAGPFTIDELLQQQLRPSDMIWIEGKSAAWMYLGELELVPTVKNPEISEQNKPIKNVDEIERKAEELRQRILIAAHKSNLQKHKVQIETYASPYKRPDDEIQFIDLRKERNIQKNTVLGELLLTFFVIGLFVVGIYKGKSFLGAGHKVQNSVATQLNSHDQHTAQKNTTAKQVSIPVADTARKYDSLLAGQKPKQKSLMNKKSVDSLLINPSQPVNTATINQQQKKEETTTPSAQSAKEESKITKEDTPVKNEIASPVSEIKTHNEPRKEEKKGFLKGLFKKKKKPEGSYGKQNEN